MAYLTPEEEEQQKLKQLEQQEREERERTLEAEVKPRYETFSRLQKEFCGIVEHELEQYQELIKFTGENKMGEHFETKLLEKILSSKEMLETAEDIADVLGRKGALLCGALQERLLAKGVLPEETKGWTEPSIKKDIEGCNAGMFLEQDDDNGIYIGLKLYNKGKREKSKRYEDLKGAFESNDFSGWTEKPGGDESGAWVYINQDKLLGKTFDEMADELATVIAKIEKEARKILEE